MSREKKSITLPNVEDAIVTIYDEDYRGNVFFTATCKQVATRLGVSSYYIQRVVDMPWGYARFKEDVLVKHGRGTFEYNSDVGRVFRPVQ